MNGKLTKIHTFYYFFHISVRLKSRPIGHTAGHSVIWEILFHAPVLHYKYLLSGLDWCSR